MAFDVGSVIAHVKADITDFKNGMKAVKQETSNLKGAFDKVGAGIASIGRQSAIFAGVAGAGLAYYLKQSSDEAKNLEKAMITLDIVSGKFGVSAEDAKSSAKELSQELRLGVGSTAESIQNLLKSGLNLEQATDMLRRFTNEAITGKSPTISLSQAVENLSFAYATNNSALGNLSGISENFQDVIKKGEQALIDEGMAVEDITEDMAKYKGMIELTNLTKGSAERFTGTLIDREAQLSQQMVNLKVAIGNAVNPVLASFIGLITDSGMLTTVQNLATEWLPKLSEALIQFSTWIKENKDTVLTFLKAFGVAITALLVIGTVAIAISTLMNPITWLVGAIVGLYLAWENNFLGIRDITVSVFNAVMEFWANTLQPALQALVDYFTDRWVFIRTMLEGVWDIIVGIIQIAWAVVYGVITVGLELLAGDWAGAWEAIKTTLGMAWEGIKRTFQGILKFIVGWGGSIVAELVSPFEKAWNKIKDLVDKIRNALDFTKRQSPSVVDIVQRGVGLVNKSLEGLQASPIVNPAVAGVALGGGQSSIANISVNVPLDGAIVSNEQAAREIGEMIGDNIIRKLQTNIRI